MYCLWIGGKKVYGLKELKDNFDFGSVEVYCLGGGLSRWLRLCGESETAERVDKIDLSRDLSEQLAEIFDQPSPIKNPLSDTSCSCFNSKISREGSVSSFSENNALSDNGSFSVGEKTDSFNLEHFSPSSYEISSFGVSSFEEKSVYSGSSIALNTSFSLESSSFAAASFNFLTTSFSLISTSFMSSSFHEYEYEFEAGGSFSALGGSYSLGSFGAYIGGSFSVTSFVGSAGSFKTESPSSGTDTSYEPDADKLNRLNADGETTSPPLSPKEKILQNIASCPLNRFGYGIHLI